MGARSPRTPCPRKAPKLAQVPKCHQAAWEAGPVTSLSPGLGSSHPFPHSRPARWLHPPSFGEVKLPCCPLGASPPFALHQGFGCQLGCEAGDMGTPPGVSTGGSAQCMVPEEQTTHPSWPSPCAVTSRQRTKTAAKAVRFSSRLG